MPETDTQPDAADEQPDTDDGLEPDGDFDEQRAMEKIRKANSEAANLRKRLKELEPLAAKAQELEDSKKSEVEKLAEARTSAERQATQATLEAARLRVALRKGLTESQAKRLVGETVEDLEKDADELLESFKSPASALPRKPTERLRGGSEPDADLSETDPARLAEAVIKKKRGF